MVCENTLGCIMCYLSFVKNGIVPILLPSNLREQEALQITQVYRARYFCCVRGYLTQNWKPVFVVENYEVYEISNWDKLERQKNFH